MTARRMAAHRTSRRPAAVVGALVVAVVALSAGACSDDGEGSDGTIDPADLVTVIDASPLEASMAEGERLGVRFPSSSSIGDDWVLLESSAEGIVEVVGEDVAVDDPDSEGSGGTVTFVVEGTAPGFTRLSFVNCFQGACTEDRLPSEDDIDERDLVVVDVAVRVTSS